MVHVFAVHYPVCAWCPLAKSMVAARRYLEASASIRQKAWNTVVYLHYKEFKSELACTRVERKCVQRRDYTPFTCRYARL